MKYVIKKNMTMKHLSLFLLLGICALFLVSCQKEPQPIKVTGITLNSTALSLTEGDTADLTATISPKDADNQTVLWSSSNGSIASVNNGKVTALAPGSTTITAKSDDGGFTASCSVTVVAKIIGVSSVSLSIEELTLMEGDSETIIATVKPEDATDKTLTWSTSDESIATVDGGRVTAINEGTATITAKAGDKSAKCEVTVKHDPMTDAISFADENIKAALVNAFDTNGDGELSYNEAASVSSISNVFGTTKNYKSFDELQYFIGLTSIPQSLFEGWQITSITIPSTVKTIGPSAFKDCIKLSSIVIPDSVNIIGSNAFLNCSSLDSVVIPESVTDIQYEAFMNCTNLASIVIPESVTNLGSGFGRVFAGCTSLSSVTIPSSVTQIEVYTFSGCTNLVSVNIPESVTKIMSHAFNNCSSLTSIIIPQNVYKIEQNTFAGCSSLQSIIIPSSVTIIESSAFNGCNSLAFITVNAITPPKGDDRMFDNTNNCPIYVPAESVDAYKTAQYWSDYASRIQARVIPEAVDLGLSVKWASFNLGASKPEEYGDYYAWGEVEIQTLYNTNKYYRHEEAVDDQGFEYTYDGYVKYITKSGAEKYGFKGFYDDKTVLDLEDDVAHVILGGTWRMPTLEECRELMNENNCKWEYVKYNDVEGYKVTSKKEGYTNNWIFLPNAFWTSSLDSSDQYLAWVFAFNWSFTYYTPVNRSTGETIRPVSD